MLKQMINLNSNPFVSSGIVDVYCQCGNMKYAELIHSRICVDNMFSTTSMIVGYSSQMNMSQARRMFDSLKSKNSVARDVFGCVWCRRSHSTNKKLRKRSRIHIRVMISEETANHSQ
ncbi:putative tetratricopeptide-like helical domain superfamily [Helianthus anomalus]